MWIDVKIPYEPGKKLALAYNRAMENTTAPWVLLLDHDVSLVNPQWYDICLKVIDNLKNTNVGLITCVTRGKARSFQLVQATNHDQMNAHIQSAFEIYAHWGDKVEKVETTITGFFMLIKREAWEKVQFQEVGHGVDKVDIDFSSRLLKAGYEIYVMKGLYVFHRREFKNVSLDIR